MIWKCILNQFKRKRSYTSAHFVISVLLGRKIWRGIFILFMRTKSHTSVQVVISVLLNRKFEKAYLFCSWEQKVSQVLESIHEKKKPHECPICYYIWSKEKRLKKHIDLANKSCKCLICDHNFTKNLALDMHIESVHEKAI